MLRYDNHGRPIGLDWTVCNDGTWNPQIWSNWRAPKKRTWHNGRRREIINPGSGRGSNARLSLEVEAQIIEMYTVQEMAAITIALKLGSTPKTVFRVLKRNDIPTRTNSRAQELRHAAAKENRNV